MTVAELIEKLSQIENQEALVMTSGYEGGYNDADHDFIEMDMVLNVNTEWYYGNHERAEMLMYEDREKFQIVKAIIL